MGITKPQDPNDDVQVSVKSHGSTKIKVHFAQVFKSSEDIVCIYVNLKEKHVDLIGCSGDEHGIPGLLVLPAGMEEDQSEFCTEIKFPLYRNWDIFSVQTSKYLISVCLTKKNEEEIKS